MENLVKAIEATKSVSENTINCELPANCRMPIFHNFNETKETKTVVTNISKVSKKHILTKEKINKYIRFNLNKSNLIDGDHAKDNLKPQKRYKELSDPRKQRFSSTQDAIKAKNGWVQFCLEYNDGDTKVHEDVGDGTTLIILDFDGAKSFQDAIKLLNSKNLNYWFIDGGHTGKHAGGGHIVMRVKLYGSFFKGCSNDIDRTEKLKDYIPVYHYDEANELIKELKAKSKTTEEIYNELKARFAVEAKWTCYTVHTANKATHEYTNYIKNGRGETVAEQVIRDSYFIINGQKYTEYDENHFQELSIVPPELETDDGDPLAALGNELPEPTETKSEQEDLLKDNDAYTKIDTVSGCRDDFKKLGIKLKYDMFTNDVYFNDYPIRDYSDVKIMELMEKKLRHKTNFYMLDRSIHGEAECNLFDSMTTSINKAFKGKKWDGTKRIDSFYKNYLCVDLSDYAQDPKLAEVYLKSWSYYIFTAIWARANYQPIKLEGKNYDEANNIYLDAKNIEKGVKADMIPVLVGKGGTGKSSIIQRFGMCDILKTSSTGSVQLQNSKLEKEVQIQAQGKIVLEFAELQAMIGRHGGLSASKFKDFTGKAIDEWRPLYSNRTVKVPRRWMPIATTNNQVFIDITDTGVRRRFAPIKVYSINLEKMDKDLEQLFLEAKYLCEHKKYDAKLVNYVLANIDVTQEEEKQVLNSFDEANKRNKGIWWEVLDVLIKHNDELLSSFVLSDNLGEALDAWLPTHLNCSPDVPQLNAVPVPITENNVRRYALNETLSRTVKDSELTEALVKRFGPKKLTRQYSQEKDAKGNNKAVRQYLPKQ